MKNLANKRLGYTFTTKQGYTAIVVEYKHNKDVIVEIQDKYKTRVKTVWKRIQHGGVENPFHPTVCNVGYLGLLPNGVKPTTSNGYKDTREYALWSGMIRRCYSENKLKYRPSYKEVEVCDSWKCFANFLQDLPYIEGYDYWLNNPNQRISLDKDIKGNGEKIYCLKNCCFVDMSENTKEVNRRLGNPMHRKENGNGEQ